MFGKTIREYLAFQKPVLILLVVVGVARLALSLAEAPRGMVVWVSINLVAWGGALYYGIAGAHRGFTYRQLLPLALFQNVVFHGIAVFGILLTIAGLPNVYAAPEFSGGVPQNQWLHAAAHLTIGMVAATLILWGAASLAMLVTRKTSGRTAVAPAA